jgi:hypothetical protein
MTATFAAASGLMALVKPDVSPAWFSQGGAGLTAVKPCVYWRLKEQDRTSAPILTA